MTLFVDCDGSDYFLLISVDETHKDDLLHAERALHRRHFQGHKHHCLVATRLGRLEDALILCRSVDKELMVHIRASGEAEKPLLLQIDPATISPRSAINILPVTMKERVRRMLTLMDIDLAEATIKRLPTTTLHDELERMDRDLCNTKFKIGVAYLDRFDTSEHQMLQNTIEDTSTAFRIFLTKLGDPIVLRGWTRFAGGLDVSDEALTGDFALYQTLGENEALFHVAPWLPGGSHHDIERKRHFGNDTVIVIFSESLYSFEMSTLLSRQTQVVFFVRHMNRMRTYQVHVYAKRSIPFVPPGGCNPFYVNEDDDFSSLLGALIDAEVACYRVPPLSDKLKCMRAYHIRRICSTHCK